MEEKYRKLFDVALNFTQYIYIAIFTYMISTVWFTTSTPSWFIVILSFFISLIYICFNGINKILNRRTFDSKDKSYLGNFMIAILVIFVSFLIIVFVIQVWNFPRLKNNYTKILDTISLIALFLSMSSGWINSILFRKY